MSLGYSKKIVQRNKCKNGDDIYVTGNIGDSYLGLQILKRNILLKRKSYNYFVKKYYLPDLPIKIIINEYLKASNFFIDDAQTRYLNALLDKISKKIRISNE